MTIVVAQPTVISTSRQPDPRYFSSLDDLVEHLEDRLDPDQVLGIPFDSYTIEVSADVLRRSRCQVTPPNRGLVSLSLQPAQDVAEMVRTFHTSEVWPARVSYCLFDIVRQILVAQGWIAAGRRVDQFVDDRLPQLITTHLLNGDAHSPVWADPRRNAYGVPDAAVLFEQLAAFQIFHELGHLIGWRTAARRGEPFSVETEQDEVNCDDFACHELWRAYGDDLELLHSAPLSCFFGVLIWTLADHLGRHPGLYDADVRQRVFSIIVRRSRAATLQLGRFAHRFEAPSQARDDQALRYLPMFEGLLALLDAFFVGEATDKAWLDDCEIDSARIVERLHREVDFVRPPPAEVAQTLRPWERVWQEEDRAADAARQRLRSVNEERLTRQRSRPMLGR